MIRTTRTHRRWTGLIVASLLAVVTASAPAALGATPPTSEAEQQAAGGSWNDLTNLARTLARGGDTTRAAGGSGASTCSYEPGAATVMVTVEGVSDSIDDHAVRVGGGGAIFFGGEPCDTATVNNTDDIVISGTPSDDDVVIDLRGGPFEPGATPEETGISEIEFSIDLGGAATGPVNFFDVVGIIGTAGPDRIILGHGGINLNADGDADILMANNPRTFLLVLGLEGNDIIRARGGSGTGGALRQVFFAQGGPGADRIVGGNRGNFLLGGKGNDALIGGPRGDFLIGQGGKDLLRGRGGPDFLFGGRGRDLLRGGAGNDRLHGGPGIDTCRPGPGRDRLISCER